MFTIEKITDVKNLESRANEFESFLNSKLKYLKDDSPIKNRFKEFPEQIAAFHSWHILNFIDGYADTSKFIIDPDYRTEMQELADSFLSKDEIQEAFTIAINSPLIKRSGPQPGYLYQDVILYRDLILNSETSRFSSAVTPEFKSEIVNKSFWELLALRTGIHTKNILPVFKDLLKNHYDLLDENFAREGLDLFVYTFSAGNLLKNDLKRLYETKNSINLAPLNIGSNHVKDMPVSYLNSYLRFIEKIDSNSESLGIPKKDLIPLFNAYINAITSTDQYDFDVYPNVEKRLNRPSVKTYRSLSSLEKEFIDDLSFLKTENSGLVSVLAEKDSELNVLKNQVNTLYEKVKPFEEQIGGLSKDIKDLKN